MWLVKKYCKKQPNTTKHFTHSTFLCVFVCVCVCVYVYKLVHIGKETYENNDIEVMVDGIGMLWLNEKHLEEKLGQKTLPVITNKYDQVAQIWISRKPKKQPNRRFLRSDLALKVIMDCRTDESCNLKRNLEFRLRDVINTKEQTVLKSIKDAFKGEDMQTQ